MGWGCQGRGLSVIVIKLRNMATLFLEVSIKVIKERKVG
jgi:hypothetical protein